MSKVTTCDHCQTQAPADAIYGNPPKSWYFFRRGDYISPEQHLCSLDCLIAHAEQLRAGELQTAQAKETTHA